MENVLAVIQEWTDYKISESVPSASAGPIAKTGCLVSMQRLSDKSTRRSTPAPALFTDPQSGTTVPLYLCLPSENSRPSLRVRVEIVRLLLNSSMMHSTLRTSPSQLRTVVLVQTRAIKVRDAAFIPFVDRRNDGNTDHDDYTRKISVDIDSELLGSVKPYRRQVSSTMRNLLALISLQGGHLDWKVRLAT